MHRVMDFLRRSGETESYVDMAFALGYVIIALAVAVVGGDLMLNVRAMSTGPVKLALLTLGVIWLVDILAIIAIITILAIMVVKAYDSWAAETDTAPENIVFLYAFPYVIIVRVAK